MGEKSRLTKTDTLGWAFGDGTPEQQEQYEAILSRFKAALSERVTKACPAQAEAQGY